MCCTSSRDGARKRGAWVSVRLMVSFRLLYHRKGTILCGVSAGMICWFEASCTDSFGPLAALRDGLGLLPGSACPHYDGEKNRRPIYHALIRRRVVPEGYAADDGAALHFVGTR